MSTRSIHSGEALILGEHIHASVASTRCITLSGRVKLRLTKVRGSDGQAFQNGDHVHIESSSGMILTSTRSWMGKHPLCWRTPQRPTDVRRGTFELCGLPQDTELNSRTAFQLQSVAQPAYYLSMRNIWSPTPDAFGRTEKATLVLHRQPVVKTTEKPTSSSPSGDVQIMSLCAQPARVHIQDGHEGQQFQELFDQALARAPARVNFAQLVTFRVALRRKKSTVRSLNVEALCALTDSWQKVARETKRPDHDECSICLDAFHSDDQVVRLPCGGEHHFHRQCMDHWLFEKSTCPLCDETLLGLVYERS